MAAKENTFEIGLVMAGAISAGAYTAGVVDFLQEALRHYGKLRQKFAEDHPGQTLHNVQIRVISGASAGGMTGTMLLSSMMDKDYHPMSGYNPATVSRSDIEANVFYRSWVDSQDGIDISYFLDNSDVTGKKPLESLLNCERLDQIADNALARPRALQSYDYIPSRIDHFLSVFNLCGVPYSLEFKGSSAEYGQVNHSDIMHFVHDVDFQGKANPNEVFLSENDDSALDANWKMLRQSTLATGAFPIALKARELAKDPDAYNLWEWWAPQSDSQQNCPDEGRCFSLQNIEPDWADRKPDDYSFLCIDGGVANNEPLEVARRALAGDELFNPRNKNQAKRAIIMVDPFPSEGFQEQFTSQGEGLFKIATRLFSSLKEQARFKPDEIEMARNPKVFSRFIIAPSRENAPRGHELASGSLGAFGGFISEKFRQHDFQLGRKNCQSFLMNQFHIGVENPLVSQHLEWFKEQGCMIEKSGEQFVQIIPMAELSGTSISNPIKPVDYDSLALSEDEVNQLITMIDKRVEKVIDESSVINDFIDGLSEKLSWTVSQWLAKKLMGRWKHKISEHLVEKTSQKIRAILVRDLKNRGLH